MVLNKKRNYYRQTIVKTKKYSFKRIDILEQKTKLSNKHFSGQYLRHYRNIYAPSNIL